MAMMNASGEWIIAPTIIHHPMPKQELYDFNKNLFTGIFRKFYGDVDATEAQGVNARTKTWKEVGEELNVYCGTANQNMARMVTKNQGRGADENPLT
jgi:hypothetical protein